MFRAVAGACKESSAPRFISPPRPYTMQQDMGRMMADLAVAEGEEVDLGTSPKKKELKIIKKRVRQKFVLSNSAIRPYCASSLFGV